MSDEIEVDELRSFAVDMWLDDPAILVDEPALTALMHEAAAAGNAHVLAAASYVFPNGAVTAALVLSMSHLTIHTWPEYNLANVDFLGYGTLDGEAVMAHLAERLQPVRSNTTRVVRALR